MIATRGGSPCIYAPSSFVYGGVTYTSDTPNEWWSNSTLSLGKLGTVPVNSGPAPGFYTGNTVAATALLTQLGVAVPDPSTPLALTATSYQGTWDLREPGTVPSATNGTTVFVNANGSVSCQDRATSQFEACTLTFTDLATGAFSYTNGTATATGTLDFATGTASGTFNDPSATPAAGSFVGGRR